MVAKFGLVFLRHNSRTATALTEKNRLLLREPQKLRNFAHAMGTRRAAVVATTSPIADQEIAMARGANPSAHAPMACTSTFFAMTKKFFFLCLFYFLIKFSFVLGKLFCFAYNGFPSWGDTIEVLLHGGVLDSAVAAYATAPLLLLFLLGWLWGSVVSERVQRTAYRVYIYIVSFIILVTLGVDTILYEKWGFKLDAVCLSYLDNPTGATQSLNTWALLGGVAAFALIYWGYSRLLLAAYPDTTPRRPDWLQGKPLLTGLLALLIGGTLFLEMRGGVKESTNNVGRVYYSTNQYLNHSAVNPTFSFFYSLLKQKSHSEQTQFMSWEEAQKAVAQLRYSTESQLLPPDSLLTTTRPNIVLVLMESCGGRVVGCTEGTKGVTTHLDSLAEEGVFFTRCYANSFRTDRGMACTFSGFPAFPDASVMKMPAKSRKLPSIARTLRQAGYTTELLYGGDKNFTNMNSYFLATGFDRVLGDVDFPKDIQNTHAWGITDHLMFDQLLAHIRAERGKKQPWFKAFMTLSSHEPWEVPHKALDDKYLNAFHYLDQSIGKFVAQLRRSPEWANTLLIFLPDHGVGWPTDINEFDTRKYHIPIIWAGGAVKQARRVNLLCNQTDLAATLLGQLKLPHQDFPFSRDVLSTTYTYPTAIHAWPEGFTFIDSTGHSTYEIATGRLSRLTPDRQGRRLHLGKAFMQVATHHLDTIR